MSLELFPHRGWVQEFCGSVGSFTWGSFQQRGKPTCISLVLHENEENWPLSARKPGEF